MEALETQQRAGDAQIDSFATPAAIDVREPSAIDIALAAINPDMLSPKEALDALYRLKLLSDPKP